MSMKKEKFGKVGKKVKNRANMEAERSLFSINVVDTGKTTA